MILALVSHPGKAEVSPQIPTAGPCRRQLSDPREPGVEMQLLGRPRGLRGEAAQHSRGPPAQRRRTWGPGSTSSYRDGETARSPREARIAEAGPISWRKACRNFMPEESLDPSRCSPMSDHIGWEVAPVAPVAQKPEGVGSRGPASDVLGGAGACAPRPRAPWAGRSHPSGRGNRDSPSGGREGSRVQGGARGPLALAFPPPPRGCDPGSHLSDSFPLAPSPRRTAARLWAGARASGRRAWRAGPGELAPRASLLPLEGAAQVCEAGRNPVQRPARRPGDTAGAGLEPGAERLPSGGEVRLAQEANSKTSIRIRTVFRRGGARLSSQPLGRLRQEDEMGSWYVAQAGLELLGSSDPPVSAS
ncbi:uncharacterized protein LOC124968083 [Sciurus carolinensis]|uniref:uncharacterized protein LOC124968083 n=1 Tax=Sciurus carolinensis TaxID=30640 RepID=UPI001FB35F9F|nr:uncharacterized protein LOC124968083 [Sciurus carolinensis]